MPHMQTVGIALNPHWYSRFWIQQFTALWRRGVIRLRPLAAWNPPACFFFTVDGRPYLIDVSDNKMPCRDPASYALYFKANYSPALAYASNVRPSLNGTTLTRKNVPPPVKTPKKFDLIFLAGISGGRHHKVVLYEALAALPLRMKLAAKMVAPNDEQRWGPRLRAAGVEVWRRNLPYRTWLEWNKQARWCVLTRGKHDCLSFKMVDYCSIGAAVVADYTPTTRWPVPVRPGQNFLSLDLSGPDRDLSDREFDVLRQEYVEKVRRALPQFLDDALAARIGANNYAYFNDHVADGAAARAVLDDIQTFMPSSE
jgi:hypothetical protein